MTAKTEFITVTELDYVRLSNLIAAAGAPSPAVEKLELALDLADQVPSPDIPADIVTMHSRIKVLEQGGDARTLTLCYPSEADVGKGMVSVLSPIGASLLGIQVPGEVSWTPPDGTPRALKIVALEFQPEANGDYLA